MADFVSRYVTLDDPLRAYDHVVEAVRLVVEKTSPDQFANPTPCAEWNVRDILNHLVETLDRYGALARGVQPVEEPVQAYDDPIAEFPAMAASTRVAFAAPGYLETVADTPIGSQPGKVTVQHVVNELVMHGWDLARGTGQSGDLVPEIAEAALQSWQTFFDGWDRDQMPDFEPPKQAPETATVTDRLAAYLGRTV